MFSHRLTDGYFVNLRRYSHNNCQQDVRKKKCLFFSNDDVGNIPTKKIFW